MFKHIFTLEEIYLNQIDASGQAKWIPVNWQRVPYEIRNNMIALSYRKYKAFDFLTKTAYIKIGCNWWKYRCYESN